METGKTGKGCKYLGSCRDTEEDTKRRKSLVIATYDKLKHILENKATRNVTKTRIFHTYLKNGVLNTVLYNSELKKKAKLTYFKEGK